VACLAGSRPADWPSSTCVCGPEHGRPDRKPFGHDGEVEPVAQRQDRFDDGECDAVVAQVAHEGLVDLDAVEGKAAQVIEAGIGRSEIVEQHAHAHRADLLHGAEHLFRALQQQALGQLQFKAAGGQAGAGQDFGDLLRQVALAELRRRKVDGQDDGRVPPHRFGAGRLQRPSADLEDQAGRFRDGDEAIRFDRAEHGMVPAQQRLEPDDAAGCRFADRLERERQGVAGHRVAQFLLDRDAVLPDRLQLGAIEAERVPPRLLGAIQRDVGMPDQDVRRVAMLRVEGDADRDADQRRGAVDVERPGNGFQQSFGE
jgi:hypothetical protein